MYTIRLISILSFILLGIVSRFVPHLPNFTAVNAIALGSTNSLKSPWLSMLTISSIMLATDFVFGFHNCMPFVYIAYGLVILLGSFMRRRSSDYLLILLSSIIFFLITNFGAWATGSLYPKTLSGLGICYFAALPFLLNQVLGDLIFGMLICYSARKLEFMLQSNKGSRSLV